MADSNENTYEDEFESDAGSPTKTEKSEPASPQKESAAEPASPENPPRSPTPISPSKSPERTPPASEPASPAKTDKSEPASPAKAAEEPAAQQKDPNPEADARASKKAEEPVSPVSSRRSSSAHYTSDPDSPAKEKQQPKEEHTAADASTSNESPAAADGDAPGKSRIAERKRLPPRSASHSAVATVSYPGERPLDVADILDPTKPLVKSTKALTRPLGPSFVEESTADDRRQRRLRQKQSNADRTSAIAEQRNNERKYLKAQQEFEREKRLAERAIYHRERVSQWATRLGASPLGVDLVADHERIDEEAFVRQQEERRRRALAEKRKRRIKNEIIVKALAEVPLLEEARRQKRDMIEEERREKALRDVHRVEAIQSRKLRDMALLKEERQAKLDQRLMNA
jgi:hypothetical protein